MLPRLGQPAEALSTSADLGRAWIEAAGQMPHRAPHTGALIGVEISFATATCTAGRCPGRVNRDRVGRAAASANDISRAETGGGRVAPTKGAGVGASCWQRRPQIAFAVCWSTQPGRVRAAILPGSYRAREAAPDMIKSPSATRKAMKKSGLRDAVDAPVRPQVHPHT